MKIEIDTKNDSKEEIIAAIKLLQSSLASKSSSFQNSEEMVDSSFSIYREEKPMSSMSGVSNSGFTDLSNIETGKKEVYVGLFDSPKTSENNSVNEILQLNLNQQSTMNPSSGANGVGLADFFSNSAPINTPETSNLSEKLKTKKKAEKVEPTERTFFKEFDDDEEIDPKVKVVPYI